MNKKNKSLLIFSILFLVFFSTQAVHALQMPESLLIAQLPTTETAPTSEKITERIPDRRGDVSFNFDDADLYSVIQTIFGEILRVNYIVDPKVTGRVTFRTVTPVPRADILPLMQVILRLNGVGVVEEAGLYRIIPIGDMSREPAPVAIGSESAKVKVLGKALLQIIPIKYIEASEMIRILTPFLSTNALIVEVPKANYIIVSDTDANIKRLLQIVEVFDSERIKQTIPQVFVYPAQNSKAKDLAGLLQQIFLDVKPGVVSPATAAAQPTAAAKPPSATPSPQISMAAKGLEAVVSEVTRIFADEITNSLIILATPDDYKTILEAIKKIDIMPRQVVIETLIAEISLEDNLKFGLAWFIEKALGKGVKGKFGFDGSAFFDEGKLIEDMALPPNFSFLAVGDDFRTLLTALATDNKLKVLASPHLLTLDNREAKLIIGDQVPIITTVTGQVGQTVTQSQVQYKDTGIILKIKPQINEGGLVFLDITQEASNVGSIELGGGLGEQVKITKREFTTNLAVLDGQSIIIGGLIEDRTSDSRSGIPFLNKIPVLGHLFGRTSKETKRTELIVLLTPRVIRNQEEAGNVTSDYLKRLKGIEKEFNIDMKKKEEISPEEWGLEVN